jgi:hypothetical protein
MEKDEIYIVAIIIKRIEEKGEGKDRLKMKERNRK